MTPSMTPEYSIELSDLGAAGPQEMLAVGLQFLNMHHIISIHEIFWLSVIIPYHIVLTTEIVCFMYVQLFVFDSNEEISANGCYN